MKKHQMGFISDPFQTPLPEYGGNKKKQISFIPDPSQTPLPEYRGNEKHQMGFILIFIKTSHKQINSLLEQVLIGPKRD